MKRVTVGAILLLCGNAMSGGYENPQALSFSPAKALPNVLEWKNAANILRRSAKLIEIHGWQQGSLVKVSYHCAATAIEAAFYENIGKYTIVDFNYAREALSRIIGVERDPSPLPGDALAIPYWGRNLMDWNDAPGRTKLQVIDAFKKAAILADQLSERASRP